MLVDLQGPKIRLGKFEAGPYDLAVGDIFTITTEEVIGTKELSGTTFKGLPQDVKPGDFLLIDDGKVKVEVIDTDGTRRAHRGDRRRPGLQQQGHQPARRRGQRARAVREGRGRPALGPQARGGLIALSFVRDASDITRVHEIMAEEGRKVPVIAKIEKPQAVDHLEEIIDAFDAIMVARGDLGVELPLEAVPIVQKHAVELARRMAKPVIVATQMLESMISSPVPTRAETSDVANAVLDGADAVMLSGETSVGEYPVITVSDHGAHRELHRGARAGAHPSARHQAAHPGRRDHARRRRGRRLRRRQVRLRVHRVRRLGPPDVAAAVPDPDEGVHARRGDPQPDGAHLGHRVVPGGSASPTPMPCTTRSTPSCIEAGLAEIGDKVVVISGSPPGIPGIDQRPARACRRRRGQRRRPGLGKR